MQEYLQGRIRLAKRRAESGDLGACYADVALILCAIISACAAARWCADNIDRRRFIELLIRHSDASFRTAWTSIPSLINAGLIDLADTPFGGQGQDDRIYIGDEIDCHLLEAQNRFRSIQSEDLRRYCYGSLTYSQLRCGYAHEYRGGDWTTSVAPSRRKCQISYIGRRMADGATRRMFCFDLDYLLALAEFHVSNIAAAPQPKPLHWWVDGE